MPKDVIIACDFPSKRETLGFLDLFGETKPFVKIGMELFYSEGPAMIKELKHRCHKVFLDLKLHDIPNTVERAMRNLSALGVDIANVHAAGGIKMMERGLKGITEGSSSGVTCDGGKSPVGTGSPLLIAVTQLTSTDKETMNGEIMIPGEVKDCVMKYAANAKAAGLGGVVCSPLEAGIIHDALGMDFMTVTPGIRLAGDDPGDQARVTDPAKARELGSDYIVVGRSITQAEDPVKAYEKCVKDFLG